MQRTMNDGKPFFPLARWLSCLAPYAKTAADLAVVAGVAFAAIQIVEAQRAERVHLAIDATAPARSVEFLNDCANLIQAYGKDPSMSPLSEARVDELNYVMSVYDNVAALCLAGLADRKLVKQRTERGMSQLVPILDAVKYPVEGRENFDALLKDWRSETNRR